MIRAAFALAGLLLVAGTAAAWQPSGSEPAQRYWNIQFELARVKGGSGFITYPDYLPPEGIRLGGWMELRLLNATVEFWKFRAGTNYGAGFFGLGLEEPGEIGFASFFPVKVGYTLLQRPVRYAEGWPFQGMYPDVFVEAELYWLNIDASAAIWKAGACAEVDRYGLGAGAELAVFYSSGQRLVPTASLYLRLVTNLGF
jgi:hypothetical protein